MAEKVAPVPPYEQQPLQNLPPANQQPNSVAPGTQMQPPQQYAPPSSYASAAPLQSLQRSPAPVDCPVCGVREMTRVEAVTGNTNHAWAAVMCFCLCLGCVPYMMSSLKNVNHMCGRCGAMLATWHNSGRVDIHQHARVAGGAPGS
ncbi:hypothetical protein P175DRAFT_0506257 [Aspergillus ochraceoroseus IBT 24754]|uniref:LITAF domain-containing protein n=2 Tax=Aspergillus ochraceoroseus TaxID=138278 RepID=A0A2T5M7Y0_9EURO|nr:uncharacterized protein P175DRAFT_0506257 [Aspergillus ochraceoroseus IBT 24754]KKK22827.1 hypothetical protein AOCH_003833 [Aspergillus ochraceoroseus]PTU24650.1 hypothetical protein P175DRAFT_0506257 [Aspergillus ochraceoroseus IBT 24754]